MSKCTKSAPPRGDWRNDLLVSGFCMFSGLAPSGLVSAAHQAIVEDLARNYDPTRQLEYDHRSYCPSLRQSPVILELLNNEAVEERIDAAVEFRRLVAGPAQIAIRRAHNAPAPTPPEPHIDGVATIHNGLTTEALQTFTLMVGVFLTAASTEFAGNFTVWPGSHLAMERYFRSRGPRALHEGQPHIALGAPRQILMASGDVILCHYSLAHAAAVNVSPNDRIAVYFRLTLDNQAEQRWRRLTNIWDGWRICDRAGPH